MHVFVTGASGWVGSEVTRQLRARGHAVTGLARSAAGSARVEAAGGVPLMGDLEDTEALARAAAGADAVVHCGFIHDFANFAHSVAVDRAAIAAMGAALAGSGKPFLVTSGIGVCTTGGVITEATPAATTGHAAQRGANEAVALDFAGKGVAVGIVRLPPSVHGEGDHGFMAVLSGVARDKGVAACIGEGGNRWPAVHRQDAARAYVLALENPKAGRIVHPVAEEGVATADIAAAIGAAEGLPVRSLAPEAAAAHFGWMAAFFGLDLPASSALTRTDLGWSPAGPGLLADIGAGHYRA